MKVNDTFLYILAAIAIVGIISGTILASTGYSSAGAFSVAAACVGVLSTIVAGRNGNGKNGSHEIRREDSE